jgi:hypothetical protein
MAPMNKCLAQTNKSGADGEATKKRNLTFVEMVHFRTERSMIVTDSTIASGKVWSKVVPVEAGKVGWVFRSYLDCA